jgi:hypothetical protein
MHRFRRGLPLGRRVVGLRQAAGMPQFTSTQDHRNPRTLFGLVEKHLNQSQMLGSRHTPGRSPRPKMLLIYISWYINGYGLPRTSSDPNSKIRPDYGRVCT